MNARDYILRDLEEKVAYYEKKTADAVARCQPKEAQAMAQRASAARLALAIRVAEMRRPLEPDAGFRAMYEDHLRERQLEQDQEDHHA